MNAAFPAGQLDGHTLVVLRDTGHRTTVPDLRTQCGRVFFDQADDDRLRDAHQIGVRGIQALGRGFGDSGEETGSRTLPSVCADALQQPAHRHQHDGANVQTDDADDRRGLGFLLQDEYRMSRSRSSAASIAPVGPHLAMITSNISGARSP